MNFKNVIILMLLCVLLFNGFTSSLYAQEPVPDGQEVDPGGYELSEYYRGKVLSVEDLEPSDQFATLEQKAEVLITSGPFEGDTEIISNTYAEGDPYLNIYLEEDMDILLVASKEGGELQEIYLHDVARDKGLIYILGIFVLLLILVGRKQGIKTIITLIFTGIVIVKIILPLLLEGYEPIPVATLSAIGIIVFSLLVIGGVNAKSFSAIVGTVCGVAAAGAIALWIGEISYLTGFSSEEAQMLYFMEESINIRGLLFAGIIIGSLGAVTDVGMSVASAAAEIKQANKQISAFDLTRGAFNVGRDIMGTMANTLVLAYVGGAIPLLLLFVGYEMQWLEIINMDLVATELVRGMAGSIGLIISIPVTALVSAFMMGKK